MSQPNPGANDPERITRRFSTSVGLLENLRFNDRLYVAIDVNAGALTLTRGDMELQKRKLNDKLVHPVSEDDVIHAFTRRPLGVFAELGSIIGLVRTNNQRVLHIIQRVNAYMFEHAEGAELYKLGFKGSVRVKDSSMRELAAELNLTKGLEAKDKLGGKAANIRALEYRVP